MRTRGFGRAGSRLLDGFEVDGAKGPWQQTCCIRGRGRLDPAEEGVVGRAACHWLIFRRFQWPPVTRVGGSVHGLGVDKRPDRGQPGVQRQRVLFGSEGVCGGRSRVRRGARGRGRSEGVVHWWCWSRELSSSSSWVFGVGFVRRLFCVNLEATGERDLIGFRKRRADADRRHEAGRGRGSSRLATPLLSWNCLES